jgi:hypothetical protein
MPDKWLFSDLPRQEFQPVLIFFPTALPFLYLETLLELPPFDVKGKRGNMFIGSPSSSGYSA